MMLTLVMVLLLSLLGLAFADRPHHPARLAHPAASNNTRSKAHARFFPGDGLGGKQKVPEQQVRDIMKHAGSPEGGGWQVELSAMVQKASEGMEPQQYEVWLREFAVFEGATLFVKPFVGGSPSFSVFEGSDRNLLGGSARNLLVADPFSEAGNVARDRSGEGLTHYKASVTGNLTYRGCVENVETMGGIAGSGSCFITTVFGRTIEFADIKKFNL